MKICPRGLRRIEGKCVYPELVKDCRAIAKRFNKSGRHFSQLKKDIYDLNKTHALDEDTIAERLSMHMLVTKSQENIHWDDVYYVMLGAGGEGW